MRLLVIGATGRTGKHVVKQALARGHEVTAFTRRPHELAGIAGIARVVHGDGLNLDDLRDAVRGQDAVIFVLGASAITRNLITAMKEAGVRRLVMTSSRSVVANRPRLPVALAWLVFRGIYADLARSEGMLEVSGLDWSVVRGARLTDKPFTGRIHTDFEANATGGAMTLARANYAMALLDAAEDPGMIGKAVGVGDETPGRARRAR